MSVGQCQEKLIDKQAVVHLAILIGIALAIGVYLIVTTVLISKDGVGYIERAQLLQTDPITTIKIHPPGYPFLILMAHKCAGLFTNDTSVFTWIYSAQTVTLLCRLLALIPLYFMGKLLVGSKNSFWALLILILLPFPAKAACEVLREWPYLLFLATGFFILLWAVKSRKWWAFGVVGLSSGLGYLIRPESAQLIIYGLLWGGLSMVRPKIWGVHRWKAIAALGFMFLGFAIATLPYMKCKGEIIPPKVNRIMKSFSFNNLPGEIEQSKKCAVNLNINTAEIVPSKVLQAIDEIFSSIGENLMWFFILPLAIGLFNHLRNNGKDEGVFLIASFILISIAMLILRYIYIQQHTSQRWSMPLVVFTVFYIPVGLQIIGNYLNNLKLTSKQKTDAPRENRLSWFVILYMIGIVICTPKLLRPVNIGKYGFKEASIWLEQNTGPGDVIADPDGRITFYADRIGTDMYKNGIRGDVDYQIKIVKHGSKSLEGPLHFNGVDTFVKTNLTMTGEPSISVSAWVKPNAASQDSIIFSPRAWSNDFFLIKSINNKWYVCLRWGTATSYYLDSKNPYEVGKWYQITGVADIPNQKLYLYVNGHLINSTSIDSRGFFNNPLTWHIGGAQKQYFNGSIDNIMIFNKSLQVKEVEALHSGGVRASGLTDAENISTDNQILAHWRVDEGASVWIEEIKKIQEADYEVLVDKQKNNGELVVIYKM